MLLGLAGCAAGCASVGHVSDNAFADDDAGDDGVRGAAAEGDGGSAQAGDAGAHDDADTSDPEPTGALPGQRGDASTADGDASVSGPARNSQTLSMDENRILDTCGEPFVPRGMEQLLGTQFSADGTLMGLASELVKSGSNAVRVLPQDLGATELDELLTFFEEQKIVVYISPGDRAWFKRRDILPVLLRHEKGLVIDAFQEPTYDDVSRWVEEATEAILDMRDAGYTAPLTVLSNQYGRDLNAALDHGQELVDADPLHNTIVGWQAYWGVGGWYQGSQGMSLVEGVEACAAQSFPMQLGIDLYADVGELMDYSAVMAAAQRTGLGWLWWNFWNPWDDLGNNASTDGTFANLSEAGEDVVRGHPDSIERTAKKACFR